MPRKKNSKQSNIYSDATSTQGAWVNDQGASKNFLVPKNFRHLSFEAESSAGYRAIRDNETKNTHLRLHTDHQGLCSTLNNHSVRHPQKNPQVDTLLTGLFHG